MNEKYLDALLDRYFDGTLDEAASEELEGELLARREARTRFWARAHLEEGLRSCCGEAWGGLAAFKPAKPAAAVVRSRRRRVLIGAAAAIAAFAAVVFRLAWDKEETTPILTAGDEPAWEAEESPSSGQAVMVATIERTAGAEWGNDGHFRGSMLVRAAPLRLKEGLAAFRFFGGARISLQGPAEFSPLSENAISMTRGFVQCEVPGVARGFELRLPHASVLSDGGVFDVRIDAGGSAELRAIQGRLLCRDDRSGKEIRLEEGEILKADERGLLRSTEHRRPLEELRELIGRNGGERLAEWRTASLLRARDPDLLVHLRMDDPDERTAGFLINASSHPATTSEAPVISADWVEGRWPGKGALAFRNYSDRVRVGVQGTYSRATYAAWVRIDDLPGHFNAIFFSEVGLRGEAHWQLSAAGEFRFGVRPAKPLPGGIFLRAFSEPVVEEGRRGAWKLLVTTYDSATRTVVHYVDGQEFSRAELLQSVDLQFGIATLGNCTLPPTGRWGHRSFGGVIDEFLLYSRVLSVEEIKALYEEGRRD